MPKPEIEQRPDGSWVMRGPIAPDASGFVYWNEETQRFEASKTGDVSGVVENNTILVQGIYPNHQALGAKLAECARDGVVSEIGLLKVCKLISVLTTHGITVGDVISAIKQAYPVTEPWIKEAEDAVRVDPLLRGSDV